jgi:hypothetical protein
MISQRCPKCRSSRIRKGYKPTPFLFRLVGIHYLLCNHCNLLFTGFAVPGTVGRPSRKSSTRDKDRNKDPLPRFSSPKDW